MTNTEVLQLEKLLTKLELHRSKTYEFGPVQVGGYIIQPIYWGEDEEGEILFDTDSITQEFEHLVKNSLNKDFIISE
jgi:hypothetical protein